MPVLNWTGFFYFKCFMDMLNDLNQFDSEISLPKTNFKVRENVVEYDKNSRYEDQPSYMKGYEMGLDAVRGEEFYTIDYNMPTHTVAFALGYNDGLKESGLV